MSTVTKRPQPKTTEVPTMSNAIATPATDLLHETDLDIEIRDSVRILHENGNHGEYDGYYGISARQALDELQQDVGTIIEARVDDQGFLEVRFAQD